MLLVPLCMGKGGRHWWVSRNHLPHLHEEVVWLRAWHVLGQAKTGLKRHIRLCVVHCSNEELQPCKAHTVGGGEGEGAQGVQQKAQTKTGRQRNTAAEHLRSYPSRHAARSHRLQHEQATPQLNCSCHQPSVAWEREKGGEAAVRIGCACVRVCA